MPNALLRMSFQTLTAQNFSFFVFGGQHGYAIPNLALAISASRLLAGQTYLAA